jgi:adenylate cyclase
MNVEEAKERVEIFIAELVADDLQSVRYSKKCRTDLANAIEALVRAIVDERLGQTVESTIAIDESASRDHGFPLND